MRSIGESAANFAGEIAKQTQEAMLEQLGDLVKSGVLIWEQGDPVIVSDVATTRLSIRNIGRFRLREQEAFDNLKKENARLQAKLATIENALG